MRRSLFIGLWMVMGLPLVAIAQDAASVSTKSSEGISPEPSFSSFKEAYSAGNQALKDRKLKEAAAAYEAAENLSTSGKGKSQAANAQGWALLKERKLPEAKKAFARSVEENGDNKVALKNLGAVEYDLYDYGMGSIEDLKDAIKNLEASGENQEDLDRAKAALGREDAAAKVTPVPIDMADKNFKGLLALSDKLQEEGQPDEALKVMRKAASIAASPNSKAVASNRLGKLLLDSHKPSESVPYFEEAVKYQPKEKTYLNNLGWSNWVLYASGKGDEADLKKAVEAFYKMNSMDPSYHGESMKMALDELKEVDPDSAKAYTIKDETTKDETTSEGEKDGDAKGGKTKEDAMDNGSAK